LNAFLGCFIEVKTAALIFENASRGSLQASLFLIKAFLSVLSYFNVILFKGYHKKKRYQARLEF
jgi:hypothetical protein